MIRFSNILFNVLLLSRHLLKLLLSTSSHLFIDDWRCFSKIWVNSFWVVSLMIIKQLRMLGEFRLLHLHLFVCILGTECARLLIWLNIRIYVNTFSHCSAIFLELCFYFYFFYILWAFVGILVSDISCVCMTLLFLKLRSIWLTILYIQI